jgi:hypothetical protein
MAETPQKRTPAKATTDGSDTKNTESSAPKSDQSALFTNDANPEGKQNVSTGKVGDDEVIDGQEHVLGDDPRRIAAQTEGGYHDSLTGRPLNERGYFVDSATVGSEGPVPQHRIVANDWPNEREKINDPAKREGNEATDAE